MVKVKGVSCLQTAASGFVQPMLACRCQRYIVFVTDGAGCCQVLGVCHKEKMCCMQFQTTRNCEKHASGKHRSFFWRVLDLLPARFRQSLFCLIS